MEQTDGDGGYKRNIAVYKAGTVICREGDERGELYILLKGKAAVIKNMDSGGDKNAVPLDVGGFFGESALFLSKPAPASLVAMTNIVLLTVSRENAYDFFMKEPGITFTFIQSLCQRLDAGDSPAVRIIPALAPKPSPKASEAKPAAKAGDSKSAAKAKDAKPAPKASTPEPAPAAREPGQLASIFPEGHGHYEPPDVSFNPALTYDKSYECPVCSGKFKTAAVRASRLVPQETEPDLRTRYNDVEPLHYDIVTCPSCMYSALADTFKTATSRSRKSIANAVTVYSDEISIEQGAQRSMDSIFAQYYLAVLCANICHTRPELMLARIYLKLSRLYSDVGDAAMEEFAARASYELYYKAYMNAEIPEKQNQQLVYILGYLSMKYGSMKDARKFFFEARSDKLGTKMIANYADLRIDEIKELAQDVAPG